MTRSPAPDGLTSEIIALAWADDISFDEIKQKHDISEDDVIRLMRAHLKPSSFKLWRKRVSGRKTKHRKRLRQSIRAEKSTHLNDREDL